MITENVEKIYHYHCHNITNNVRWNPDYYNSTMKCNVCFKTILSDYKNEKDSEFGYEKINKKYTIKMI